MLLLLALIIFNIAHFSYTDIITQISLQDFLQKHPQASALQCTQNYTFKMNSFPLYPEVQEQYYPSTGTFSDIFIVNIPHGSSYLDQTGYIFINDYFISETQIKNLNFFNDQPTCTKQQPEQSYYINGRVAIISHLYPYCYGHWILDVLCQLALLEIHNIEYDYLMTPYYTKFMQESLELWGIDQSKIIPLRPNIQVSADTLIMSTAITSTVPCITTANYTVDFLIKYVRNKLIDNAQIQKHPILFPKKIFISRKDAGNKRNVPNEDEIFSLFEARGFQRAFLTSLSFLEQVALFYNAQELVSFVGSGAMNLIFSQPNTKYIEITQSMVDPTFFFLTNIFNIDYYPINYSTIQNLINHSPWTPATPIPLNLISDFLHEHQEI